MQKPAMPLVSEFNLKINWSLNIRNGRIVYMPPEEYMERVNIFNRIGMSRVIEDERKAIGSGYRGIGYYPPLSEQSYRLILEGIRAGNEMDIPNIVYRNGLVENQEGFHRSLVARDLGIEKIPVQVIGEMPSVFSRALNLHWNENLTEQVKAINALKGNIIGGVEMIRESVTPEFIAPPLECIKFDKLIREFVSAFKLFNDGFGQLEEKKVDEIFKEYGRMSNEDRSQFGKCVHDFSRANPKLLSKTYLSQYLSESQNFVREATTPAHEPVNNGFRANPGLINKQAAYAAHTGTSFEPEKRGEQAISGFAEGVQAVYERLKPHARTDAEKALLLSEMERFQASYAQKYNDLLYSHSRIYSTMIAGASGFPAERMRKINEAYDKKSREVYEWKDRAEKAMLRALKGLATEEAGGEIEVQKQKIAQAEKLQEMMVEGNKIIRKKAEPGTGGVSKQQQLINLGFTERQAMEALKPDYMGRFGFPAFALSNNSANIRRMKERVIELEKREVTPTADIKFEGGTIQDSKEYDRVRIFFDEKPGQAVIDKLKAEGWRWSPAMHAWQRKRTENALYSARRITGAALAVQPQAIPTVPTPSQTEDVHARIQKVIDIIKIYRDKGATYEDFVAGLKGYYLEQSGYVMGSNLNVQKLTDDLKKSGYHNLRELWRAIIVQAPERPPSPVPAPQPYALPELRWVYGTKDGKWHLVGPEDRDYAHGITQERMRQIGQEAARAEYLSPSLARTAVPVPQVPAVVRMYVPPKPPLMLYPPPEVPRVATPTQQLPLEESGDLKKLIFIIEKYVTEGTTYEDFSTGRTFLYLSKSGVKLDPNNIPSKLKDDLRKAGYNSLSELWNDTSRKLRMRLFVPPKQPQRLLMAPKEPEAKKYTTPRLFKKGTIARNSITSEKFALEIDVEAFQQDKNAMIWKTDEGHYIYIDDQRPAAIPAAKEPEKISSDDTQLLKTYEKITDYAINQRITLNQGKLKELAARRVVRIEKGKYGTMGSAYLEQERIGISEEISRLKRVQELRELMAAKARPEPWKLTQEEYWRAGAGGKAYEGRGTSDFNHKGQVVLALAQGKPVSAEVLKDYPDIVARIRQENEALLAKDKAERDRLLAIEKIEENELNAELNSLPPSLKRHAETEIYGTLHMLETHKDYRNRFYIALGKVRRIAFTHLPGGKEPQPSEVRKEEPIAPLLPEQERVLKAYLEKRGHELTLRDFVWADKYTIRGTAKYPIRTMEEKRKREEFVSKNYDEELGKKYHRGTVESALKRGIKVPEEVLKEYPDIVALIRAQVAPRPSIAVAPPVPPGPKKFVQRTFQVEERMRRYGYA